MEHKPWPHPYHRLVVILATLLDFMALAVGLLSQFLTWFELRKQLPNELTDQGVPPLTKLTKFKILDEEVFCLKNLPESDVPSPPFGETVCAVYPFRGEESNWRSIVQYSMFAGCGLNGIVILIVVFAFWPLAIIMKNVLTSLLKVVGVISLISLYVKLVAGFIAVNNMVESNKSFAAVVPDKPGRIKVTINRQTLDIDSLQVLYMQVLSLPLGFIFASVFLEMLALTAMKVAVDVGVKGEYTHLERLEAEAALRAKIEEERKIIASVQRSSSYHPDSRDEHASILTKASNAASSVASRSKGGTSQSQSAAPSAAEG